MKFYLATGCSVRTDQCYYHLIGLILLFSYAEAHLNLYLNQQETMRLLGLSAELYYVRDGQVNEYALHFTVPVPANVKDIAFTWQSLAGKPLPYQIKLSTSDPTVLPLPVLNISSIGEISTEVQTFDIELKCSGIRPAEVEVTIAMEITLNPTTNNVTELVFRRNKICLESDPTENSVDDPLLLETLTAPPSTLFTLIVGGILAILLVIILIIVAYCAHGPSTKRNPSPPVRTSSFQRLPVSPPSLAPSIISPPSITAATGMSTLPYTLPYKKGGSESGEELYKRIGELTVQRCRIRLSNLLQEGTFGRIYRGTYNDNQDVLVKTVVQHASQTQVSLLLTEGMSLYGASHVSILSVLGVSIDDHTAPFLLYPASENMRNLKMFLQEPAARKLTTIQIVKMATQLVQALGHLHSHGVIHKDVGARNCVIDDQRKVKLADNTLARDLFPGDYHCLGDSENRPIKWMALEVLQSKQYSEASDTWAFGVLMWELCTLARQPFAEIDPFEMERYLQDGYRLAQPVNCPDELFAVMAYCWAAMTHERPTFGHLQICLQNFYSQLTRYV